MPRYAKYAIVIKTDSYAGNFEREMCAYLTGQIGECEVGKELINEEIKELFDGYIQDEPDDNGCYRPVTLGCDVAGFTADDVVIFFGVEPTDLQLTSIQERMNDFAIGKGIKILGVDFVQFHSSITRLEIWKS